jgi:TonB-linked SusC/RagA family outer membrane protein
MFLLVFLITYKSSSATDGFRGAPSLVEPKENLAKKSFDYVITGKVTDESNQPLIGVSIRLVGGNGATQTNLDGNYSINVITGTTALKFTYLGFEDKEIVLTGDAKTINVILKSSLNQLQDVVVVGYSVQKKESVVGAISQIKGEDLLRVGGVSSVSESLQGLLPGLTAINTNGKPGSDGANLLIRGRSTFNGGSAPFILVDGIERDLDQVDPNEIESISVLKDASATAVYGTRGANGVILVTTKRGKKGTPQFSFTSNFGFKNPTSNYNTQANYVTAQELYNEGSINDKQFGKLIPESRIQAWRDNIDKAGPYNQYFPQVDWNKEIIKDLGFQKSFNLNAAGGSDFMRYFVSAGYLNDGDILNTKPNDEYDPSFRVERYNWRSNFDFDLTKSTVFSVNFSGNFRYRNQAGYQVGNNGNATTAGGEDGFGQPQFFSRIISAPRNLFPLRYQDGAVGESNIGDDNVSVFLNDGGQRIYKYFQGFYDASIDQKLDFITKGLSAKGKISYTSGSNYETAILRDGVADGNQSSINTIRFYRDFDLTKPQVAADGSISYPLDLATQKRFPNDQIQPQPLFSNNDQIYGYTRDLYYEASINYTRKFGNHDVSALGLVNRRSLIRQGNTIRVNIGEFGEDYVGRVTYGFKSRYLAEFNGSYTGSSKFAIGQKFGFFPSGAVGYIVTEEPFVKKLIGNKILDFLKVRYNYGIVGSDRGVAGNQFLQSFNSGGQVVFGNQDDNVFGPLYSEGPTANPNNTWEKATKQNLGIEFDFFNKLRGSLDLFNEEHKDILTQRLTIPRAFGNTAPVANIGKTKNHGYELQMTFRSKIGQNFNYNVGGGYNWSENRNVFRDDARLTEEYLKLAGKQIGSANKFIQSGYYGSLNDIYNGAAPNLGVTQNRLTPGDFLYTDYNGDGVIDQFDQVPQLYTNTPLQTLSLNLGFDYKNWGFNMLFYSVQNVFTEVPDLYLWDFDSNIVQGQPNITGRWTPENAANATKPALHTFNTAHNQDNSSNYTFVDASYVRLKSAEISYRLNLKALKNIGVRNVSLYTNGNNLITITKLDKRLDPESGGSNVYPIVRRYNLGLRANF